MKSIFITCLYEVIHVNIKLSQTQNSFILTGSRTVSFLTQDAEKNENKLQREEYSSYHVSTHQEKQIRWNGGGACITPHAENNIHWLYACIMHRSHSFREAIRTSMTRAVAPSCLGHPFLSGALTVPGCLFSTQRRAQASLSASSDA